MARAGKKLFVKSFGCQMNEYDSARILDVLADIGYEASEDVDGADVVVLNTCHIREKAAEKVYSELGRIKQARNARLQQGKDMVVVVAGCMAQAEGREIIARAPLVSIVIGPQNYHRLPQYVFSAQQHKQRIVDTEFPVESKFDQLPAPTRHQISAFLTVQEGCDKFCTFCVVPYTRGGEFSRPIDAILRETEQLVAAGAREIMLLGQNVNAYHGADQSGSSHSLAGLIERLADIDGLARIRYTTSHPNDMSDELIDAHRNIAKLMPYLHLPFQAGSDRMLDAMNRKHTRAQYLAQIERIRAARPDIALSTDIIVGFPGETDADFAATLSLVREVGYAQAFSFKYSARPGTPAADMADQVADEIKDARLQELQELLRQQQLAFNQSLVGTKQNVLFEDRGKLPGQLIGRSPYLQPVHAMADASLIGSVAEVAIIDATRNSLTGDINAGQSGFAATGTAAE